MTTTGLEAFDSTVHKTNGWLRDLMDELEWSERHKAYLALRVTLHCLRDRLTVEEAAQLAAQLPMLVRGFYYEGWVPTGKPERMDRVQFLARIGGAFRDDDRIDPEGVARAVFQLLSQHVDAGEIDDVKQTLPRDLEALWT